MSDGLDEQNSSKKMKGISYDAPSISTLQFVGGIFLWLE